MPENVEGVGNEAAADPRHLHLNRDLLGSLDGDHGLEAGVHAQSLARPGTGLVASWHMGIPGALRPRSNSEILDAAFALARRVGPQLLPLSLLLGLPISVLALRFSRTAAAGGSPLGRGALGFVVIVPILESLRTWVLEAALIEAIVSGQVSWPAVRRRFFSVFWRLVGSQIALVWLGGLCSIRARRAGRDLRRCTASSTRRCLLAEGKAVRSSFRRSFALTDGGLGRLGMLVLAGTLLLASLNWGFSLWAGKNLLGAALGWIGAGCIALVKASFYLLAYYDLRARREGFDLLQRDAELELQSRAEPSPA